MKHQFTILALIGLCFTQCPDKDQLCGKCGIQKACLYCYNSYLRDSKCVVSTELVRNCSSFSSDGICSDCKEGYYLDANNSCKVIDEPNCYEYSIKSQCLLCKNSLLPVDGICSRNKCTTENCMFCDKLDKCKKCNRGFGVDESTNKCVSMAIYDSNCLVQMYGKCALCNYGYFDMNGVCYQSTLYSSSNIFGGFFIFLIVIHFY